MFLSEQAQQKWTEVLDHPELPKISDPYKRAVTAVILENQEKALAEERAQADRMNQEARNAYQQDRLNPNLYREAAQENALRDQARFDANADRYGGDRFGGGGFRGGFGGGRMGGFRR